MPASLAELMVNPAFQSGVAPFVVALLVVLALRPLGGFWAGLALTIGVGVAISLMMEIKWSPLTSTRKTLLLALAAAPAGMLLDHVSRRRYLPLLLFVAGAAAVTWVIWPVLTRREGVALWALGIGGALYVGWLTALAETLRHRPLPGLVSAAALGFATGGVVLFGASALLGQIGLAIGAAAAACLLVGLFGRPFAVGLTLLLPAALLSALLGFSGLVYARAPWYALPVLALIPLAARVPVPADKSRWLRLALIVAAVAPLVMTAVALAWWAEGAPQL